MVEDSINIRRASQADAKILTEISALTFFDTFKDTCTKEDMDGFIEEYFNIDQLISELQNPNDFYFIAFFDDRAVGYLRLKEDKSDVAIIANHKAIELKRIYVLKEFISKKIGASLMKFALNFAEESNYEIIWLGVWEHNERAKRFYQKFGFEDTGVQHPFPIGSTPQTDNWMYRFVMQ